jgi:hypothetical protein
MRILYRRNVFTQPLPRNGSTCYNLLIIYNIKLMFEGDMFQKDDLPGSGNVMT